MEFRFSSVRVGKHVYAFSYWLLETSHPTMLSLQLFVMPSLILGAFQTNQGLWSLDENLWGD